LGALIEALRSESPEFARMWSENRTAPLDALQVRLRHPQLGALVTGLVRFVLATEPEVVLSVLPAEDERTAAAFERVARRPAHRRAPARAARSGSRTRVRRR